MRLESEFVRLPLQFDVERLQQEVLAIPENEWITHPTVKTNMACILVSVDGQVNDEFSITGQMAPTETLKRCPYLRQVIASFKAPASRTRLMLIGPRSHLGLHDDIGYHWYRRTRIHVPVFTNPKVSFTCNGKSIHMKAGESWIFDNFLPHEVENGGDQARIHLVIDTRGSEQFWRMADRERVQNRAGDSGVRFIGFDPGKDLLPEIEAYSFEVITPEELDRFVNCIHASLSEHLEPGHLDELRAILRQFSERWRVAFERFGHSRNGLEEYATILGELTDSALFAKLSAIIDRYSEAGNALAIMATLFARTNRRVEYSPDSEILNISFQSLRGKTA